MVVNVWTLLLILVLKWGNGIERSWFFSFECILITFRKNCRWDRVAHFLIGVFYFVHECFHLGCFLLQFLLVQNLIYSFLSSNDVDVELQVLHYLLFQDFFLQKHSVAERASKTWNVGHVLSPIKIVEGTFITFFADNDSSINIFNVPLDSYHVLCWFKTWKWRLTNRVKI